MAPLRGLDVIWIIESAFLFGRILLGKNDVLGTVRSMSGMAEIYKLLNTPEPPGLGPGPRAGVEAENALNKNLDQLLKRSALSEDKQQRIRALVLLWHDHLEPAHVIAQEVDNADGAFVHGIMHRREPDYGNAKYWFRRVGDHSTFPEIATKVSALLEPAVERQLREQLLPRGRWDPFAFVDACEKVASRPNSDGQQQLLRDIQRVESETLLEFFFKPARASEK